MPKNTRTININFDASMDISQIQAAVSSIEKSFNSIKLPQGISSRLVSDLQKLQDELNNFSNLSSDMKNLGDVDKSEKSLEKITSLYKRLQQEISEVKGLDINKLLPNSILQRITRVNDAFESYQSSIKDIGKEAEATQKRIQRLLDLKAEHRRLASTITSDRTRQQELEEERPKAQARVSIAREDVRTAKKSGVDVNSKIEAQKRAEIEAKDLEAEYKRVTTAIANNTSAIQKNEAAQRQYSDITDTFGTKIKDLRAALESVGQTQAAAALQKFKDELSQIEGFDVSKLKDDLSNLGELTKGLSSSEIERIEKIFSEITVSSEEAEDGITALNNSVKGVREGAEEVNRTAEEIENLKRQVLDFFSIGNAIELFKRAISSAYETVKELDAAMTETAVVTDFSVGDMWDQLPQYTKMANELGVSILGAYDAATLYYQQGLKTNEVMAVSNETLKMARIAGMEAADATDLMTAALRGFNMEINEASAQRINDVYSELAAVTAADTEEIGIAMSKTASIAASANMEFETTAALLSQIIETTREAPETAGTAMKTIIARFTEVKSLFSEGELTGVDAEGEEININKIDEALKSVGISLKDFLTGTKGIDDIFLELASKWDTLDIATQRYIATTAAGSRQQSRFLAMMSNYDRTMELVNSAYNSTGASQEQFNKTLDSMETKLAKLRNAWDQFVMGLANNEFLKSAVDILTNILTTINNLIESISGGNGLVKTLISLTAIISTLKSGKAIFNGIFKGFGSLKGEAGNLGKKVASAFGKSSSSFEKEGKNAGNSFSDGLIDSFKSGNIRDAIKSAFSFKEDILVPFRNKDLANLFNFDDINFSSIGDNLKNVLRDQVFNNEGLTDEQKIVIGEYIKSDKIAEANEEYKKLGQTFQLTGQQAKDFGGQLVKTGLDIEKVGAVTSIAGGLIVGFSNILKNNTSVSEGWANGIRNIGVSIMAVGPAFKALQGIISVFSKSAAASLNSIPGVAVFTLIAAAIASVVSVIQSLNDSAYKNSLEGRLEEAQKTAEVAKTSAEEAQEAYDNLLNGYEEYNNLQSALDNLIEGTDEFTEALIKANQQVLELLNTYPELAKYIQTGEYGQLELSQEGMKAVQEQQLNQARQTQGFQLYTQLETSNLESQKNTADFLNSFFDKLKNDNVLISSILTPSKLGEIINNISAQGINFGTLGNANIRSDIEEILSKEIKFSGLTDTDINNTINSFISELEEYGNEIDTYLAETESSNKQQEELYGQLVDNFIETRYSNYEQKDLLAKLSEGAISENLFADLNRLDTDLIFKEANKTFSSMDEEELIPYYAELKDLTEKQVKNMIEEQNLDAESMKKILAVNQALDNSIPSIDNFKTALNNVFGNDNYTDEQQKVIRKLLTDEGLSREEMQSKATADIDFETLDKQFNLSAGTLRNRLGENFKAFNSTYNRISNLSETLINNVKDAISNLDFKNTLTPELQGKFVDIFSGIELRTGSSGASQEISKLFNQIAYSAKVAGVDTQKALNFLSEADFSTTLGIDTTIAELENLGIEIDDELTQKLYSLSNAIYKVNLDSLIEQIEKIAGIRSGLKDREATDRAFSSEDYASMIESGASPEDFVFDGQQYIYINGADLNFKQLYNQLGEGIQSNRSELENTVEQGSTWEEALKNNSNLQDLISGNFSGNIQNEAVSLYNIANQLGLQNVGSNINELLAALRDNYDYTYGEQGAAYTQNQQALKGYNAVEQADLMSRTGSEILASDASEENKNKALEAKIQTEGLTESYKNLTKQLKTVDTSIGVNERALKALIIDTHDANKSIDEMNEAIDNNIEVLKKGEKNGEDYQKALFDISASAREVFGEVADTDFVEKYKDDFLQLAEGGEAAEEAFNRISYAAGEATINSINSTGEITGNLDEIRSIMDQISSYPIEIGGTADFTDIFNELAALVGGVNEAAAIIEAMGYRMEWVVDGTQTIQVPVEHGQWANAMQSVQVPKYRMKVTKLGAGGSSYSRPKTSGGGGGGGGGSGGSGGSSKEKEDTWENPYDELYNLTEKVNEALRQREKIERAYDRLLDSRVTDARKLAQLSTDEINKIKEEINLQKQLQSGRLRQIQKITSETYQDEEGNEKTFSQWGVTRYANYNANTGVITIDWEDIDKITDTEKGGAVEAYISRLEELQEQYEETQTTIEDMEDLIIEIKEQGRDQLVELNNRVYDAIVAREQKTIDDYQELSDTISDSNSKILNSLQESIDLERQIRDNTKIEEDIADKEARLAYLRRDTSGANDLAIKQLEEELVDARESYGDTLVDQEIERLSKANEEAAEQRERQIEIMQAQLDYNERTGVFWKEALTLISKGFNADGTLKAGSELADLLQNTEDFKKMSDEERKMWEEELNDLRSQAQQYQSANYQLEDVGVKSGSITFYDPSGKAIKGTVQSDGSVRVAGKGGYTTYSGVYRDQDGTYRTLESSGKWTSTTPTTPNKPTTPTKPQETYPYGKASETTGNIKRGMRGNNVKAIQYALNKLGYGNSGTTKVDGIFGSGTTSAVKAFQRAMGISADGIVGVNTRAKFRAKQYKTGGLADYTGLAWLDGTRSKPELILNSEDTKNLIQLKDILSEVLRGTPTNSQSNGDNYFEININVEEISSDYDVEKLADKIKEEITNDATYRNVNAINFLR